MELAESNKRYLLSFEDAPTGMAQILSDGEIVHVNSAFAELLGLEVDALIGQNLQAIVVADDWAEFANGIATLISGESDRMRTERRLLPVGGDEIWVLLSLSLVRDQLGRPLYLFVHAEDVSDARSLRDQLVHAAEHDRLTGLPNRALFLDRLDRALNRAHRDMRQLALMFIDVDRFKEINDGLGHRAGDGVLRGVAERLQGALRPDDVVARYGGDEFTVLCEVGNEAEARWIAARLQGALLSSSSGRNSGPPVTLSIGIAISDPAGCDASLLLHQADTAMYTVKSKGGDDTAVYRTGSRLRLDRAELTATEIQAGFDRREFQLQYQPIVELATGRLLGLEVVPRWLHPTYGNLRPDEFMRTPELLQVAAHISRWALDEACRQGATWRATREQHGQVADRLNLAVPVSAHELADSDFPIWLGGVIDETEFPSNQLWLEIGEGIVLGSQAIGGTVVDHIRALGVHIAVDAFGTERSSLNYLKELPVELVKFDRSYIDHIEEGAIDEAMVQAMLALTKSLSLTVIADGVERPLQATLLSKLGCTMGQGPLYGDPLLAHQIGDYPADDLTGWSRTAQSVV